MTLNDYLAQESGNRSAKWWDCGAFVFRFVAPEILARWPRYETRREALALQREWGVTDARSYRDAVVANAGDVFKVTDAPHPGDIAIIDCHIPAMGLVTAHGCYFKQIGGGLRIVPTPSLANFITRVDHA